MPPTSGCTKAIGGKWMPSGDERTQSRRSFSRVQRLQDGSVFPLHWDGSFMKRRSFNAALTHLLACVHEAGCFAQRQDPTVQLPYRINSRDGKIGDARSGDLSICYAK